MAIEYVRQRTTLLVIMEMYRETTERFHNTPTIVAKIKKRKVWLIAAVSENAEPPKLSYVSGGNAKQYSISHSKVYLENNFAICHKVEPKLAVWPRSLIPRYFPRLNKNCCLHKN